MATTVGILVVASLALLALTGNKRASKTLQVLFWAFIALILAMLVGFAVSVW